MGKSRGGAEKPAGKAKNARLQIRLSDAEKEAFRLAAELDGKKISEWIRDRLRRDSRIELKEHGKACPFLSGNAGGETLN